jgi:predicted nucleic acid-binding protein
MFIRCAEAGKVNTVISGDQHLLGLESYGKVKILAPFQFLKKLQEPV